MRIRKRWREISVGKSAAFSIATGKFLCYNIHVVRKLKKYNINDAEAQKVYLRCYFCVYFLKGDKFMDKEILKKWGIICGVALVAGLIAYNLPMFFIGKILESTPKFLEVFKNLLEAVASVVSFAFAVVVAFATGKYVKQKLD